MPVELAEYGTEIEMSVGERLWVLLFELQFEGLDQVGKCGSDFAIASIIACQVVVGGGFEGE